MFVTVNNITETELHAMIYKCLCSLTIVDFITNVLNYLISTQIENYRKHRLIRQLSNFISHWITP